MLDGIIQVSHLSPPPFFFNHLTYLIYHNPQYLIHVYRRITNKQTNTQKKSHTVPPAAALLSLATEDGVLNTDVEVPSSCTCT